MTPAHNGHRRRRASASSLSPGGAGALQRRSVLLTAAELYELAAVCAGIGAGAVMREAPKVEMPTEAMSGALRRLLEDDYNVAAPPGWS